MQRVVICVTVIFTFVMTTLFTVVAQEKETKKEFQYGGVATCKACHLTKKSGAQYKIWQDSPHAKAYETLASPEAQKIAKEKGIADPQKSDKCLKCHITGYGVDAKLKGEKLTLEEGVSCEACHGPGSAYKGKKVMEDIYAGKVDGASLGLIKPTEEVCKTCHNQESPTFKAFNFKEMVAKIAHPVPKEQ